MIQAILPHLFHAGHPALVLEADAWLVVISQTCDVVQPKLDNEPFIEILHCHPIAALRAEFKQRKSTRRLDFKPNTATHQTVCLTAHATADRYQVPRRLFAQHNPDATRNLSKNAVRNIQAWYALRYSRSAWPQTFVERIDATKKKLLGILEPIKDDVAEVRISLSDSDAELPNEQSYRVAVFFVVPEEVWNSDPEARQQVTRACADFISALNGCKGITVDEDLSGTYNGAEFTWEMARRTDEWNFANLSPIE